MIMETVASPTSTRTPLITIARLYIVIATLPLLILIAVRLVMTPLFLQIEHTRPGFPADPYGFTTEDRLLYGPLAVAYLLNGDGIEFLGDQTFADGVPLYNERELRHMADVKVVTQAAFGFAAVVGLLYVAAVLVLARQRPLVLRGALRTGAIVAVVSLIVIVVGALFAWEYFFTTFHALFFADGTWYFPTSDTLIRLFPEQFWFDAAITIGGLTLLGAALLFFGARLLPRRSS